MKMCYEVANNNLNGFKDKLKKFCEPMGEDIGEIEEEIVPYPELYNKISIIKGEVLERNDQHKIMLLTAKAVQDKNEELYNLIVQSVDEKLAIKIESEKMKMQGMSEEEVAKYTQEMRSKLEPEDLLNKNWMSELEIFNSKALQYCMYDQDIKLKQMDTMEDAIVADRFFVFSGWKHGKPYLNIRNPLFLGYHKNPNERFVQKGDWIWYKQAITPSDAINNYKLSDEELARLGLTNYAASGIDVRHDVIGGNAIPVFDKVAQDLLMETDRKRKTSYRKDVGLNMSNSDTINRERALLWETHFEFKAFKELVFLNYTDEYNKQLTEIMPGDFVIPDNATKEKFVNMYGEHSERYRWVDQLSNTEFTAEKLWIPRKYEVIRLGNDVYPIFREVPYQYTNIEQPYSTFELSTKGVVFNARNTKSVSSLQRALAPYFQLLFLKHIQNRELSKYQGAIQSIDVDQIPENLGQDVYGNPIRDKVAAYLTYLKRTNKDFYSGSQNTLGGLPPATRSPGSNGYMLGTAAELMNLQQLIEYVKREVGMAMGISPQREASFSNNSNVTDNKQALTQSYHITEPMFFLHSEVWKSCLNDWLMNFRTYCENIFKQNPNLQDYSVHFFLPDGTAEMLKVTPKNISNSDVGLFLMSSGQNQRYTDYMLQLVHAFSQNAGEGVGIVSGMIKDMISGASPEEIHKRIQIEEKKQADRQQQMQQAQGEQQKQMLQMQIESEQRMKEIELELIHAKAEEDRITRVQVATIQSLGFAQDQDMNNNEIPDVVDIAKLELDNKKLDLEVKKFDHQKQVDKQDLAIKARKTNKTKS
jgi:hypothetical protein